MQRVALAADIAEEKAASFKHASFNLVAFSMAKKKKKKRESWQHVITFRGESAAHCNANMEMPAVAES